VTEALQDTNGLMVLDCGSTPENFIEKVCTLAPARIIIVDACDYGAESGALKLFSERQIEKISHHLISTHTLPLSLTVAMIKKQLPCQIQLLGVQPEKIDFGENLSPKVKETKNRIVEYIKDLVKERSKG
jgi:hydrogenase 3 maturation protease